MAHPWQIEPTSSLGFFKATKKKKKKKKKEKEQALPIPRGDPKVERENL